jgi:hypothetical protein
MRMQREARNNETLHAVSSAILSNIRVLRRLQSSFLGFPHHLSRSILMIGTAKVVCVFAAKRWE